MSLLELSSSIFFSVLYAGPNILLTYLPQVHISFCQAHWFVSCFSLETTQCSCLIQFRLKGTEIEKALEATYAIVTVPTNADLSKCTGWTETWISIT